MGGGRSWIVGVSVVGSFEFCSIYISHVAGDRIRIRRMSNCLIFIKKNSYCYQFNFGIYTLQTMQKDYDLILFCLLCCMNWYSWGFIHTYFPIRTHSLPIRRVVKFYNHTLRLRCGCIPMRYPLSVLIE